MSPKERFRELEKLAGNNVYPVVHTRWGYAAFCAYVFRIKQASKPDEWWVGELNEEKEITRVFQICLY